MYIERKKIDNFFKMMNQSKIRYVLIKNIGNELPNQLKKNKDIDILVHPEDKRIFKILMKQNKYLRILHPYGKEQGWTFLYQMDECYMFCKEGLYVDVCFQLCCKSLMPKSWIPLDASINISIWGNRYFDQRESWYVMDDQNLFVYLLVRCIFDKKEFSPKYIKEIDKYTFLTREQGTTEKLSKIFFKYTPHLLEKLDKKQYNQILQQYISFVGY